MKTILHLFLILVIFPLFSLRAADPTEIPFRIVDFLQAERARHQGEVVASSGQTLLRGRRQNLVQGIPRGCDRAQDGHPVQLHIRRHRRPERKNRARKENIGIRAVSPTTSRFHTYSPQGDYTPGHTPDG